jgi:hypothetical protein
LARVGAGLYRFDQEAQDNMKNFTTMISVLFLGAAISMAGCKKDDAAKKDDKAAKKTDEGKKDEPKKDEPKKDEGGGGGGGSTGMANCDALIEAYAALAKCDKMPAASRDAMVESGKQMQSGWGDMSKMDDATKKATDDSCKQAVDGLKTTMSSMGC